MDNEKKNYSLFGPYLHLQNVRKKLLQELQKRKILAQSSTIKLMIAHDATQPLNILIYDFKDKLLTAPIWNRSIHLICARSKSIIISYPTP